VALALGQLGGAAPGPHGFADAAQRAAAVGVGGHEVAPRRDDAAGVAAEVPHLDEVDAVGVGPEGVAQELDLLGVDRDQRGLAGSHSLAEERHRGGHELVETRVEEGLMPEVGRAVLADHGRSSIARPRVQASSPAPEPWNERS
jgi:hypothetical protein